MKSRIARIIFFSIIGIAIIFGYYAFEKNISQSLTKNDNAQDSVNIVETPLELGGSYSLTTHKGDHVTEKDFQGKILLMFFGYTYCPDYCPMELQNLSQVMKDLDKENLADKVQPLFISVDPNRDTAAVLSSFLEPFDHRIIAMTGTEEQINDIKGKFRIYAAKTDEGSNNYLMDHSTFLYVLNEKGEFVSMIRYEATADEITEYVKSLLKS